MQITVYRLLLYSSINKLSQCHASHSTAKVWGRGGRCCFDGNLVWVSSSELIYNMGLRDWVSHSDSQLQVKENLPTSPHWPTMCAYKQIINLSILDPRWGYTSLTKVPL